MTDRTLWHAPDLGIEDEPLAMSLIKYRQSKNRTQVLETNMPWEDTAYEQDPNLVASITHDGRQMMILDMDFPHHIEPSTTPGHSHLYLDVPMTKLQWFLLMCALKYAGVIELGFFVWSVRRGGNFVRLPGATKEGAAESTKSDYGWFFKLKKNSDGTV